MNDLSSKTYSIILCAFLNTYGILTHTSFFVCFPLIASVLQEACKQGQCLPFLLTLYSLHHPITLMSTLSIKDIPWASIKSINEGPEEHF